MQEKAWKKVIESENLVWMGRNEREDWDLRRSKIRVSLHAGGGI